MGQILSFDRGAGEESSDLASKSEINLINNQKKRNGGNRLQKRSSPVRAETFSERRKRRTAPRAQHVERGRAQRGRGPKGWC